VKLGYRAKVKMDGPEKEQRLPVRRQVRDAFKVGASLLITNLAHYYCSVLSQRRGARRQVILRGSSDEQVFCSLRHSVSRRFCQVLPVIRSEYQYRDVSQRFKCIRELDARLHKSNWAERTPLSVGDRTLKDYARPMMRLESLWAHGLKFVVHPPRIVSMTLEMA
jgi:hypothetical protein